MEDLTRVHIKNLLLEESKHSRRKAHSRCLDFQSSCTYESYYSRLVK